MRNEGHLQLHSHFHLAMTSFPISPLVFDPTNEALANNEESPQIFQDTCFICKEVSLN